MVFEPDKLQLDKLQEQRKPYGGEKIDESSNLEEVLIEGIKTPRKMAEIQKSLNDRDANEKKKAKEELEKAFGGENKEGGEKYGNLNELIKSIRVESFLKGINQGATIEDMKGAVNFSTEKLSEALDVKTGELKPGYFSGENKEYAGDFIKQTLHSLEKGQKNGASQEDLMSSVYTVNDMLVLEERLRQLEELPKKTEENAVANEKIRKMGEYYLGKNGFLSRDPEKRKREERLSPYYRGTLSRLEALRPEDIGKLSSDLSDNENVLGTLNFNVERNFVESNLTSSGETAEEYEKRLEEIEEKNKSEAEKNEGSLVKRFFGLSKRFFGEDK